MIDFSHYFILFGPADSNENGLRQWELRQRIDQRNNTRMAVANESGSGRAFLPKKRGRIPQMDFSFDLYRATPTMRRIKLTNMPKDVGTIRRNIESDV